MGDRNKVLILKLNFKEKVIIFKGVTNYDQKREELKLM